jgi:hypothetical protein
MINFNQQTRIYKAASGMVMLELSTQISRIEKPIVAEMQLSPGVMSNVTFCEEFAAGVARLQRETGEMIEGLQGVLHFELERVIAQTKKP